MGLQMGFQRAFWKSRWCPYHLKPERFRFYQFHALRFHVSF